MLFLVFRLWYPAPLHEALGVTRIFRLLILVDMVIGPLLTLLVFKAGKKTLIFDMAVILALQLSALCYGVWSLAEGRPIWLVFNADRFDLVRMVDIDTRRLQEAEPEYQGGSWLGPQWVGAVKPADVDQRNALIFESVMGGSDIAQRPNLYRPLTELHSALRDKALPLQELHSYNEVEQVREVLARWPSADAWLPLMALVKPLVVLFNRERAEIVAVVDLRPWK